FGSLLGPILPDASYVDWPVTYDQLEPFYAYAEASIGVQGEVDPHGGPRSSPYPMTPGPAKYVSLLLADAARRQGYQPFRCPRAVNSRPYGGRPACVNCGFCAGFGCASNARGGSTAVSLLREALLGGNCQLHTQTRVHKLLLSGDGRQVVGVQVIGPDGTRQVLTADTYLLATGPIEDARLVLYSEGSDTLNPRDLVGRNFCGRSVTVAVGIFDYRIHQDRGNGASFSMTDLRGDARDRSRPIGGLMTLGGEQTLLLETGLYLGTLRVPPGPLLKKALRQSIGRERMAYLSMYVEDPPQLQNRIDLDPLLRDHDGVPVARITYQRHPYAVAASAYFGPKQLDILQAAGAQYGAALPLDDAQAQCGHHGGTLRFGSDDRTSVCTPQGRFHGVGNLFGTGGSLFCSLPGYNPTLTMSTLGLWVAANLVFPGSPERAVTPLPTP
ncbi:MAG TPA: GMC oxidoreductase, partial [Pseudomonadota bacterium]|nr:GMC oxidoreductase [Pseudomonadota bacterium]